MLPSSTSITALGALGNRFTCEQRGNSETKSRKAKCLRSCKHVATRRCASLQCNPQHGTHTKQHHNQPAACTFLSPAMAMGGSSRQLIGTSRQRVIAVWNTPCVPAILDKPCGCSRKRQVTWWSHTEASIVSKQTMRHSPYCPRQIQAPH